MQIRNLNRTAEQAAVPSCSGSWVLHGGDTLLSQTQSSCRQLLTPMAEHRASLREVRGTKAGEEWGARCLERSEESTEQTFTTDLLCAR